MTSKAKIEAKTQAFLDQANANKGPQIFEIPPSEGRKAFNQLQASTPVKKMDAEISDITVPSQDGDVKVKIVRPKNESKALPVLLYIHGAGWVFGGWETHDRLVLELANKAGIAVAFVEYSLSPEAKSGVAIRQSIAAVKYIKEHARQLNIDTSRMAVGGDSVGGNMSIALTLEGKNGNCPKFDFQLLFYPVTDSKFDTESYKLYGEKHFLTTKAMHWFWDQYEPDTSKRSNPLLSPLQSKTEDLKGLPPAVVITAECDVLRDEGEAYARKLMEAEVRVQAVRCLGTIHDFVMLNAITDTPAARTAIDLASTELRQHLFPALTAAKA